MRLRRPYQRRTSREAGRVCRLRLLPWRLNQNGAPLLVGRLRISSESATSASIKSNMVDCPSYEIPIEG